MIFAVSIFTIDRNEGKMRREAVILIAEDDPGHRILIKKSLARSGIHNQIVEFTNGKDVLDFFFESDGSSKKLDTPYILILDIKMPKMDGIEVLRRIKNDDSLKKIPVAVLSTTDDPHEIDDSYELGCCIYIVKPLESGKFVDTIKKLGDFLTVVTLPEMVC